MAAQLIEMKNKDPEFFDSVLEQLPVYESSCIMDAISYTDWGVCSGKCKGYVNRGGILFIELHFLMEDGAALTKHISHRLPREMGDNSRGQSASFLLLKNERRWRQKRQLRALLLFYYMCYWRVLSSGDKHRRQMVCTPIILAVTLTTVTRSR